jgi:hypothetical protein
VPYNQTGAIGALSWGIDCGLWELMARNGDGVQSVNDLASPLGVDPVLLGEWTWPDPDMILPCRRLSIPILTCIGKLARLMRHLGAMGLVKEVGADEYQTTNFTKAMCLDIISGAYIALYVRDVEMEDIVIIVLLIFRANPSFQTIGNRCEPAALPRVLPPARLEESRQCPGHRARVRLQH